MLYVCRACQKRKGRVFFQMCQHSLRFFSKAKYFCIRHVRTAAPDATAVGLHIQKNVQKDAADAGVCQIFCF